MKCLKPAAGCLLSLALAGCQLGSMGEGRLRAIDANLDSLRHVSGRVENSPYKAWFQQMDLQLIEEQPAEGSELRKKYYFHKNELFYYRQLNGSTLEQQFFIDKHGAVRNTVPQHFPASDLQLVRARAEELNKAAILRAGQMFVFPLMRNP